MGWIGKLERRSQRDMANNNVTWSSLKALLKGLRCVEIFAAFKHDRRCQDCTVISSGNVLIWWHCDNVHGCIMMVQCMESGMKID